ncbi:hypothetical protein HUJ04_006687 [Dendroctonus ponderosae]|nr:hypothetical protein HUJ04_006687 [Dendroctonus ponderosae]
MSSEPSIKSKSIRDDIEIVNGVLKCVKSSSVADSYASSTIANTFREFFKHAKDVLSGFQQTGEQNTFSAGFKYIRKLTPRPYNASGNFGQSSLDPEDLSPRVKNAEQEDRFTARACLALAVDELSTKSCYKLHFIATKTPIKLTAHRPDLTPLDIFLWVYLKDSVCFCELPAVDYVNNIICNASHYSCYDKGLRTLIIDFPAPPLVDNKKSTPYIIQQHTHKVNSRVVQLRSLLTLISDVRYYRETGKKHMLPTNTIYSQLLNITELSGKQMIIPRVFFSARSNLFRLNPADNHQHMKQLISPKIDEPESKQIVLALKLKSTRECRLKEVMYGAVKLYDFDGISDTKLTRDNCLSTGCCTFFGPIWPKLTVLTLRRSNMD